MSNFNEDDDFEPDIPPAGGGSTEGRQQSTDIDFDIDFDANAQSARHEEEAAQLEFSLTQIIGGLQEIKTSLRRQDIVSATREKNEAQRVTAITKLLISPAELAQAASTGAQSGSTAALAEVVQRIDVAGQMVRTVNERLVTDAQRRESERDLWIQATMYAAIGGAIAILAGVVGGYFVGKNAGSASGYATARDEVAAANWANTTTGAFARQLSQDGTLQQMRDCSGEQWRIQKIKGRPVCFAGAVSGNGRLQGWFVP